MIFADTSALFAFLVADDRHHVRAVLAEALIRRDRGTLWTIDPVLPELWLLLRRETDSGQADRLVSALLDRGLRRHGMEQHTVSRALALGREWPDQGFSLTVRQAFAAIEAVGEYRAWSYDNDFAVIRVGPRRSEALQLVR
ncbi:MAG: hypothetical protein U0821_00980 [Chloroflexota bacterium]